MRWERYEAKKANEAPYRTTLCNYAQSVTNWLFFKRKSHQLTFCSHSFALVTQRKHHHTKGLFTIYIGHGNNQLFDPLTRACKESKENLIARCWLDRTRHLEEKGLKFLLNNKQQNHILSELKAKPACMYFAREYSVQKGLRHAFDCIQFGSTIDICIEMLKNWTRNICYENLEIEK